jgi:hypothetical protein
LTERVGSIAIWLGRVENDEFVEVIEILESGLD